MVAQSPPPAAHSPCTHPPPPVRPAGSIRWRMAHSHEGGGASGALQGLAYAGGMALGALQYGGMADNAVVSIVPHVRGRVLGTAPGGESSCRTDPWNRPLGVHLASRNLTQPPAPPSPTSCAGQRADCSHRDDARHVPRAPRWVGGCRLSASRRLVPLPFPALNPSQLPAAPHTRPRPLGSPTLAETLETLGRVRYRDDLHGGWVQLDAGQQPGAGRASPATPCGAAARLVAPPHVPPAACCPLPAGMVKTAHLSTLPNGDLVGLAADFAPPVLDRTTGLLVGGLGCSWAGVQLGWVSQSWAGFHKAGLLGWVGCSWRRC